MFTFCRICLTEKLLANVFSDFHLLLLINVKNDGMAFSSCKSCFSRALEQTKLLATTFRAFLQLQNFVA